MFISTAFSSAANCQDNEEYFEWKADHLLQYRDFGIKSDFPDTIGAFTVVKIAVVPWITTDSFFFELRTLFNKKKSGFNIQKIADSTFILRHEQIHFDIYELGRRMFIAKIEKEIDSLIIVNQINSHQELLKMILSLNEHFSKSQIEPIHKEFDSRIKKFTFADTSGDLEDWQNKLQQRLEEFKWVKDKKVSISQSSIHR